jgi:hypothetical protein
MPVSGTRPFQSDDRTSQMEQVGTAMSSHRSARDTAEAKFAAKLLRHQEGRRAMSEHEAESRRVDEKTARLRALRLGKEAAETAESMSAATTPPNSRKRPDR